jgi:hypothetical protein
MTFYAYVNARPNIVDQFGIFYVGKGNAKRMRSLNKAKGNRHHRNIVNKYGAENIGIGAFECTTDSIAQQLEVGLIKCLRRSGVKLTNMTDGGEGSVGYVATAETKTKIGAASKKLWGSDVYREKMLAARAGCQKGLKATELKLASCRLNAKKAHESLRNNPEVKEAGRIKNSIHSKAMWADPVFAEKAKAANKASWTVEKKALHSAKRIGTKILNNGMVEKRVKPTEIAELISNGWILGRKPNKCATS